MAKGKIATASITWQEDLIETEGCFYIKLSPNVVYKEHDAQILANEVAKEALSKIKKGVKGIK